MHAKEVGSIDKNGVPLIEVVVDGAWSKRSYKTKYDALSGVATIIGSHTGKVLYFGVKNKYCVHCERVGKGMGTSEPHTCTKNFTGSSTSMESAILVEGFKMSLPMYGVKYHRLIGDGDSSVYSKIVQSRPYTDTTVEKIECRNHLLRNYSNKLKELVGNTKFSSRERKLLECRLLRLRSGVKGAIQQNKGEPKNHIAIQNLRADILNGVAHVFGNHTKCADYFCKKADEENLHDGLSPVFLTKIMEVVRRLANHARSLLHDVDSNVVEQYNSIVAKFVGGKRVNYALKNSYSARCAAAVLNHNTHKMHTLFRQHLLPNSDNGKIISKIELRRRAKITRQQLLRKSKQYEKKRRQQNSQQDKDYGDKCQTPDMEPIIYVEAEKEFLESLQRTENEKKELEEQTRFQIHSGLWMEERRKLLTASNFAKICKRRISTDTSRMVKSILYGSVNLSNVPSIRHGQNCEDAAKKALQVQKKITIERCGLIIDKEFPYFGASPDGVVGDDSIVEIKCPYTAFKRNMSIEEAISTKTISFWKVQKNGELVINKNHDWYFQVQGQLHITGKKNCIFCVWIAGSIKSEIIKRDDEFWKNKMQSKLQKFYFEALLPELVDSRRTRNLPLRTIIV